MPLPGMAPELSAGSFVFAPFSSIDTGVRAVTEFRNHLALTSLNSGPSGLLGLNFDRPSGLLGLIFDRGALGVGVPRCRLLMIEHETDAGRAEQHYENGGGVEQDCESGCHVVGRLRVL